MKPSTEKLINDFGEAAKTWGWESDQGWGEAVNQAKEEYEACKKRLVRRVRYLERKLGKHSSKGSKEDNRQGSG